MAQRFVSLEEAANQLGIKENSREWKVGIGLWETGCFPVKFIPDVRQSIESRSGFIGKHICF